MTQERNFVAKVEAALPARLGRRVQVATSYAAASIEGIKLRSEPDLTVYDPGNRKVTLIDFKGLSKGSELPLATVAVLRQLREANKEFEPDIVLATASRVSPTLRRKLAAENFKVVEFEDEDRLITDLAGLLNAA